MWTGMGVFHSSIASSLFFFLFLISMTNTAFGVDKNCTEGEWECFTCMGRDKLNCDWGRVCCSGACWKLIDDDHDIIAKGCTKEKVEDGSSKLFSTQVELPWAKDNEGKIEKLRGTAHYCAPTLSTRGNKCNGSNGPIGVSFVSFFLMLFTSFILVKAQI